MKVEGWKIYHVSENYNIYKYMYTLRQVPKYMKQK